MKASDNTMPPAAIPTYASVEYYFIPTAAAAGQWTGDYLPAIGSIDTAHKPRMLPAYTLYQHQPAAEILQYCIIYQLDIRLWRRTSNDYDFGYE